jgi:hypothetical protein
MKVSDCKGVANHTGPESCGPARKCRLEALTGESTSWVLSREMYVKLLGADALEIGGRQYGRRRKRETPADLARSETPNVCRNTALGNREIPPSTRRMVRRARIGKPKGDSR